MTVCGFRVTGVGFEIGRIRTTMTGKTSEEEIEGFRERM
jgi:hypothetical protein